MMRLCGEPVHPHHPRQCDMRCIYLYTKLNTKYITFTYTMWPIVEFSMDSPVSGPFYSPQDAPDLASTYANGWPSSLPLGLSGAENGWLEDYPYLFDFSGANCWTWGGCINFANFIDIYISEIETSGNWSTTKRSSVNCQSSSPMGWPKNWKTMKNWLWEGGSMNFWFAEDVEGIFKRGSESWKVFVTSRLLGCEKIIESQIPFSVTWIFKQRIQPVYLSK